MKKMIQLKNTVFHQIQNQLTQAGFKWIASGTKMTFRKQWAQQGKFKWIGTRTLQFIPETQLFPSTNYTIKIKSDFRSLDGLSIDSFEHKFVTRKLRYNSIHTDKIIYNQPIRINFNQGVDMEKTVKEITIAFVAGESSMPLEFVYEYGTKKTYNKETKEYDEEQDESTILIFNTKDKHGRKKFWDFNDRYQLTIQKAYPAEGDIILDERRKTFVQVTDIIENISATSERTHFSKKS